MINHIAQSFPSRKTSADALRIHRWFARCLIAIAMFFHGFALGENLITNPRFIPLTQNEIAQKVQRTEVFSDRVAYWNDDGRGQFIAVFTGKDIGPGGERINLELAGENSVIETQQLVIPKKDPSPKFSFFIRTDLLKPGKYTVKATMENVDDIVEAAPCEFVRVNQNHPKIPIPADGIPLQVHAQNFADAITWPISTGVPMPFGTLANPAQLVLLEDGKPASAQWAVRSTWTPGEPASVRWLSLDFLARYEGGKPKDYRIKTGAPSPQASPLNATETADSIVVNTGAVRFQVNRKSFKGIEAAWLDANKDGNFTDDEQVIKSAAASVPPAGPYLVDEKGAVYKSSADPNVEVQLEESGPVRATLAARGWYRNETAASTGSGQATDKGQQLCRFVTRFTAYAGQPAIRVSHRTIVTYDTPTNRVDNPPVIRLADVGFAIPLAGATRWATGIDGKPLQGDLPSGKTVWIHQERWNKVRLAEGPEADKVKASAEGEKADGWFSVQTGKATATGFLRDIWQKFPKEIEADRDGLTFHFWPRHGRQTFTPEEEFDRKNIYKLWWMHQGRFLDFQMPKAYFDKLQEWHAKDNWDPEHTADIGYHASCEGVSFGGDFSIVLSDGAVKPEENTKQARLFQMDPHALSAPAWNVAAGVESPMTARDDKRWPDIERLLNESFPQAMLRIVDYLGDYGMWIYANTHNPWDNNQPRLHRIWQNSHYQHVGFPWMLYFRGGAPDLLRWARAQTDNFMDVGFTHYHNSEKPIKFHTTGGMYHAKAFMPWGARRYGMYKVDMDGAVWGHWIDPDAFLMRYYLEGNPRAWDLYRTWGNALGTTALPYGPGREASNTLGQLLNYYPATWDPQAIMYIRDLANAMLGTPFEKFSNAPSFPIWHKTWPDRYYDLVRDQRIVPAVTNYIAAGFGQFAPSAFAYRTTGDKKYLARCVPGLFDQAHQVYR
ncbi:MAG: hypothetical protein HY360_17395, partial [Verrucomicrobia bacterium]|nr:hypothetical protein [Verrucomicrobiota bacterium]